jgi:DNA ligase (NAD+)
MSTTNNNNLTIHVSDFLRSLSQLKSHDLENIKGIGPILADNVINFATSERLKHLVSKAESLEKENKLFEVKYKNITKKISSQNLNTTGDLQAYYIICITGTFERSRNEIKEILDQYDNVEVVDSITKNTNILLCGEKAGSKLKKAQAMNIEIYYSVEELVNSKLAVATL